MRQKILSIFILSILLLSGCGQISLPAFASANAAYQKAEVLLEVILPSKLPSDTKLQLEVLDDVTGLSFNPVRSDMIQKDDRTYYLKTAFTVNSIVKYRYLKTNQTSSVEFNAQGQQVRFRVLKINGPLALTDTIAAWQDEPYSGGKGSIRGQFTDSKDNTPLPNLLVSAEGIQTITASDGTFILQGLTPGTHNFAAIALDGSYNDFQQGAIVAQESTTPVFVSLERRPTVDITFEVNLPADINSMSTLRFASNLYSLGNLYGDVFSATPALAADLPVMQTDSKGISTLKLTLPVGAYLSYKYTLGDGFWNGELNADGSFKVRELIVPDKNTTIKDVISTFQSQNSGPILFEVKVPTETPVEDTVSLEFNPSSWAAPLPMTKVDAQTWSFMLYNPQSYFGQTTFRFCRNTDCELTKEIEPPAGSPIRTFTPGAESQTIQSVVEKWQLLASASGATTVTTEVQGTQPRPDFITGFEIDAASPALLRSYEPVLYGSIATTLANWVILEPTWTASWANLPLLEPVAGVDLLWPDVLASVQTAKQANMAVALFPMVRFPNTSLAYWVEAQKDAGWWQSWFDRYHRFMIQNADAANLSGASAIILGDPGLAPSLESGTLPDGSSSGVPADADAQWRQLIQDIRARYSGTIIGAVNLPTQGTALPNWIDSVDAVYLMIRPEIPAESINSFASVLAEVDAYFENDLKPLASQTNKPILIGLSVPSTSDAYLGCSATGVNCILNRVSIGATANLDLELQAKITNAAIMSASSQTWINGFFSRGYQAAGSLQDTSDSVHGKPANDVLWYWYHFLSGKTQ